MSTDYIITREEVERARRRAREIKETYGISAPWQLLIYVPEEREAEVVAGISADFLNLTRVRRFIARPTGYKVYDSGVVFKYQNRVKAWYPLPMNGEERIRAFRAALKSVHVVTYNGGTWHAKPLETSANEDLAKKCVEERGWAACLGLMAGLTEEGAKTYWWRFIPLVYGHIIELSAPGTGKSTFYVTLSRALNVVYMNELPSFAYLIADARDGSLGAAATADVIVIDELDKIEVSADWAYNALLSGLEQGVWVRARGRQLQYENPVGAAFIGNCGATKRVHVPCDTKLTRGQWSQVLSKLLRVNADPLVDRMALIVNSSRRIKPEYISNELLKPDVVRGLYKLMNKDVKQVSVFNDPRADRQASALAHVYQLIFNRELSAGELGAIFEEGP